MANLTTYFNTDDSSQDLPLNSSGVEWTEFSSGNDKLIFTNGSTEVADGQDVPTQSELLSAGVILDGTEKIIPKYIMEDISANVLRELPLMGNLDAQYVLAFDFDDATASEPVLEVWDDTNLNTANGIILGSGTASSSFLRGVTTTDGSSGTNWAPTATRMAGSSSGNFLFLNDQNGALTTAKTLYATLAMIVSASQTNGFSATPVLVAKWLST